MAIARLRVKLIVGNGGLETDFRTDPGDIMFPGAVDLGSTSTGAIIFGNAGLRDATDVALAVSGDIHGNIDAGTVFSI